LAEVKIAIKFLVRCSPSDKSTRYHTHYVVC